MVVMYILIWLLSLIEATEKVDVSGPNWMSFLPDDKPLNQITLPGTHDTTAYGSILAKMTKTQNKDLQQQLDMGVRFLDLRIRHIPDKSKFVFAHGPTNFKYISFEDAMNTFINFLQAHPTETMVISFWPEKFSMKWGQTKKVTTQAFEKWLKDPINPYMKYFYKFQFRDSRKKIKRIPTLGEVRGKMVMMSMEMNELGFKDIGKYSLVYKKEIRIPDCMWNKHVWQKVDLFQQWYKKVQIYNKQPPNNGYWGLSASANAGVLANLFDMGSPMQFAIHINPRIKHYLLGADKVLQIRAIEGYKKKLFSGWLAFDFIDYELAQLTVMDNKEIWDVLNENCPNEMTRMKQAKNVFYNEQQWTSNELHQCDGTSGGLNGYFGVIAISVLLCSVWFLCLCGGAMCGFVMLKIVDIYVKN